MGSFYEESGIEIREINQHCLESFIYGKENMFESSADIAIEKIIKEEILAQKKYDELIKNNGGNEPEVDIFEGYKNEDDIDLDIQLHQIGAEQYFMQEELWALIEMKIIYLYKFFEINIKKLLRRSFSLSNTKDFYRWDSIINFLNTQNINSKEISVYNEIVQLKDVNNSLKHSDSLEEKLINKIPEFKNKTKISYVELNQFYDRVKIYPEEFINQLVSKIYDELYKFDEDKIEGIAEDINSRMEEKDALVLIEKIKASYRIK